LINNQLWLIPVIAVLTLCSCGYPTLRETSPPVSTGKPLIRAIEEFRSLKGAYPETLEELVPDLLRVIPAPEIGVNRWVYKLHSDNYYELSVPYQEHSYESMIYDSRNDKWWIDQ
jgi:hypothetical protein